jgi:hypothetical protein
MAGVPFSLERDGAFVYIDLWKPAPHRVFFTSFPLYQQHKDPPMKRLVVIAALVLLLFAPAAFSQEKISSDSMIEMLRSDIRTEKRALIEKAMKFTEKEAGAFWPFYREYELEAGKIVDMRIAGLKDYAANYDKITDEKAEDLVEKTIKYQEERLDLLGSYYTKASKVLGPKRAAQWIQVENQINTLLDAQMTIDTPLIK